MHLFLQSFRPGESRKYDSPSQMMYKVHSNSGDTVILQASTKPTNHRQNTINTKTPSTPKHQNTKIHIINTKPQQPTPHPE